ncbi:MAG TPA: NAD(P)H-dependent oxidoreductase [Candidatus Thermoplasmatota archaeon]|nr:NAD(P)H-dependent oxidoreductase [Candidatus Thermoplasmatota archaeon]
MTKIAIILGSTRPNRNGEAVARWAHTVAQRRGDAQFDLIDVADLGLPLLDEPVPPSMGHYSKPHTKAWAAKVAQYDGFVFVTPEYNHGTSAALKNALDYLYKEWNNKAAGFVAYGSAGGTRAVEHLRLVAAELQMATVRAQVALSLREDFENFSAFKPRPFHEGSLNGMLDQLIPWSNALRSVREPAGAHEGASRPARPSPRETAQAR